MPTEPESKAGNPSEIFTKKVEEKELSAETKSQILEHVMEIDELERSISFMEYRVFPESLKRLVFTV
ncbi:MAG: hypothetical protein P9L92_05405 [Candidatus Electryonea clarkiae]|nr:hypothetical protein [Candidatus Electryonea clarkiae]